MQIDDDMAEPVFAVARFMASGEEEGLTDVFAPGRAVILENFPPYLFQGPDAVIRWREGFKAHAKLLDLDALEFEIGHPHDFAQSEDRVFFTLPVRWTGFSLGRPFDERGGWTFVLTRVLGRWRILSYAWAVTQKS
jgi:hypothetical protein